MDNVKYKFSLTPEVVGISNVVKEHEELMKDLSGVQEINEIIKVSVSYMRKYAEEEDTHRVKVINEILYACKKNGLENIIPFVTKGLLFFEESSESFREMIINNFIPDEEKEVISNLMQEMEKLSEEERFDKESLERKSQIREELSDYQDMINGKIQEAIAVNFKTENMSYKVH